MEFLFFLFLWEKIVCFGMLIVNTPWQFREQMHKTLTELVAILGSQAAFRIVPLPSGN